MEKYTRVPKVKEATPINHNEIRVTTQGFLRNYLSYATTLLQDKQAEEIVLKAMGQAVSKTVELSEIIKQRIPNLHQDIAISSVSFVDVWEPIEEGLLQLETTRQVSMISITLSFKELNTNSPGYQAPSQNERQPRQQNSYQQSQAMQGRGGYNAVYDDSYGRGRGSWRGRGADRGQGWGRGGYGTYHDNGGYSNRGGGVGRGRNWGYQDDGGYHGGRSGYQQNRGGYQGGRGGYQHNRGGYQGGRGGYHEGGGGDGYQGNRGGYHEGAGGYQGGRGGYQGGRGGYQGGRGGYPDGRRRYHDADGGEGGYDEGYGGYQGNRGGYRGGGGYQGARGGGRGYGRGRMGERSRGGRNDA